MIQKYTWETYLSKLSIGMNNVMNEKDPSEEDILRRANKRMQDTYPGKYIVETYYNAKKGKFDLRLKFENTKEELMWKLRWV